MQRGESCGDPRSQLSVPTCYTIISGPTQRHKYAGVIDDLKHWSAHGRFKASPKVLKQELAMASINIVDELGKTSH